MYQNIIFNVNGSSVSMIKNKNYEEGKEIWLIEELVELEKVEGK